MSTAPAGDSLDPAGAQISRPGGVLQITIDGGATASGMMNFSVNILARLSKAGIDTLTFGVTVLVGNYITWSPEGSKRFYDAISKAPVHKGFSNILWFGFGHKSPIQILAETDAGSRFTAISSCLTEVYSINMAAQIMMAFSKRVLEKMSEPKAPLPSLLQMHLLVEKCAGIFSAGSFPLWAEQYMSFDGEAVIGQHAWPKAVGKTRYSRGVSNPIDIADALYGLVELSGGDLRHLTLVGVADAGLIAAIGAWLLDLKLAIYVEDDKGEIGLRFRNVDEDLEPQLTVIYSRHDSGTALSQREKTVRLQDATILFKSHAQSKPNQNRVLGGRVHWKEALQGTFKEDFKSLLGMPVLLGTAIGSAARIFSALVEADENVPQEWLRYCSIYFPDSFGQNFVEFAQYRFPELSSKHLKAEMVKAAQANSYSDARAAFELSMNGLASSCGCKVCCPTNFQQAESTLSENKTSAKRYLPRYCFVALTGTLIRVTRALSGIDPIEGLHPTRAGLEYIYETQQTRIQRLSRQDGKNIFPIVCSIVEHAAPDLKWTEVSLLRFAQHIFGGQTFHDENDDPGSSATAIEGLCCYLEILREPIQDDPIALARVNVIPGYIQYEGRLFHRVGEKSTNLFAAVCSSKNRPKYCVPEKVVQSIERCFGGTLELLLTEEFPKDRRPSLEVDYGVVDKTGMRWLFGPSTAVRSICRSSGLVTCWNDGCQLSQAIAQDLEAGMDQETTTVPVCKLVISNSTVTIFDGGHVAVFLAAFGCWEPLFQRGECIACCVRTGCRNGWDNFAVVRTDLFRRTVSSKPLLNYKSRAKKKIDHSERAIHCS